MLCVPARLTWSLPPLLSKVPIPPASIVLPPPTLFFKNPEKSLKKKEKQLKKSFFSCQCWTDDWCFLGGDVELYCKKKQTYFSLWSGKKTKKTQELTFSLSTSFCWSWWLQWCATLSLPWRTDRSLTGWPLPVDFMLPVCALCVLGVTLTGRTKDSPLGGAALRHGKGSDNPLQHKKPPL